MTLAPRVYIRGSLVNELEYICDRKGMAIRSWWCTTVWHSREPFIRELWVAFDPNWLRRMGYKVPSPSDPPRAFLLHRFEDLRQWGRMIRRARRKNAKRKTK